MLFASFFRLAPFVALCGLLYYSSEAWPLPNNINPAHRRRAFRRQQSYERVSEAVNRREEENNQGFAIFPFIFHPSGYVPRRLAKRRFVCFIRRLVFCREGKRERQKTTKEHKPTRSRSIQTTSLEISR